MYPATHYASPSVRAQTLSQELIGLLRQRRAQDPGLGVSDAVMALELAKASLLSESGLMGRRVALVVGAAIALIVALGVVFFSALPIP